MNAFFRWIASLFASKPATPTQPPSTVGRSEASLLREAMDKAGITDNATRAGVAAIVMGESNMKGHVERGYGGTSVARIRQVFGSRVQNMSDAEVNDLKADERRFFNHVYGLRFQHIHHLGNTLPDDGYNFRGRGFLQLTGRANYEKYGALIGKRLTLLANPDLANDPAISAQLTAVYIKDRYKGGGWEALLACVGNNTPDIKATKTAFFNRFLASGEFNG